MKRMSKYFDPGGVGGRTYSYIKITATYIEEPSANKIQSFYYSKAGKHTVPISELDSNLITCLYKKNIIIKYIYFRPSDVKKTL